MATNTFGRRGVTAPPSPTLLPGLGRWHHAVVTRSPLAQRFFDQGLRLAYAFNSTVLNSAGRITSSSSTSSE